MSKVSPLSSPAAALPSRSRRAAPGTALAVALVAALTPAPGAAQVAAPGVTLDAAEIRRHAAQIDRLVRAGLRQRGERPNARTDDATFARRAYLSLAGRIPTVDEIEAFLVSSSPDKRSALIDVLLLGPGYANQMFHWWADLLRIKSRLGSGISGEPYAHWVKDRLAENAPFDVMVTELVTAEGAAHRRGNGATGYYLRDRGMPLDSMANTARTFLGTRLECAQCHNHPFDRWTQREFYEMAAFTGGLQYTDGKMRRTERGRQLTQVGRDLRREDPQAARAFRRVMRTFIAGIGGSGSGMLELPDDYRYEDASPGDPVTAHAIFGSNPELDLRIPQERRRRGWFGQQNKPRRRRAPAVENDTRAAFAAWLTAPDNPRFTLVIANRMWRRVMGRGLIEPVDAIDDQTTASHPELMAYLEDLMLAVAYDLREFQRVLLHTETYGRQTSPAPASSEAVYAFPGPLLQRMSAEQLWDSLLTLIVEDLDETILPPEARAEQLYSRYDHIAKLSEAEILQLAKRETLRETDPDRYREARRRERLNMGASQRSERVKQMRRRRDLRRQIGKAKRRGLDEQAAELQAELEALEGKLTRRPGRLVRAADLSSPARADHLLRTFGQSDREQIEAASTEASVPQALTLMNGVVDQQILRRGSALMRQIEGSGDATARIRTAFLAILSREPSAAELRQWRRDTSADAAALNDLVWVLCNSHEFRSVH
ncbi:MAG: DUF1549 domain-containing protein [Planctomycetota bacterium]